MFEFFPLCSWMSLIFTDFQQCKRLRSTSCSKNLSISEPLGIPEEFKRRSALPNVKYYCELLFLSQMHWLCVAASRYILSQHSKTHSELTEILINIPNLLNFP